MAKNETKREVPEKIIRDGKKIQDLMARLGCSREAAIDIILADYEIDNDLDPELFELTAEQKAAAKEARTVKGARKRAYTHRQTHKLDDGKRVVLEKCKAVIEEIGGTITEYKPEVETHFTLDNGSYTLKIIKHRDPKPTAEDNES